MLRSMRTVRPVSWRHFACGRQSDRRSRRPTFSMISLHREKAAETLRAERASKDVRCFQSGCVPARQGLQASWPHPTIGSSIYRRSTYDSPAHTARHYDYCVPRIKCCILTCWIVNCWALSLRSGLDALKPATNFGLLYHRAHRRRDYCVPRWRITVDACPLSWRFSRIDCQRAHTCGL